MSTKIADKFIVLKLKPDDDSDEIVSKFKICRVCLKKGNIPIFEPMPKIGLIKLINVVTNLSIDESDEFPKYLCRDCYNLLKDVVVLVKTARRSREILENNIICMDVDDDEDIQALKDLAEKEMLNTVKNEEELIPEQNIKTDEQEYFIQELTDVFDNQNYLGSEEVLSSDIIEDIEQNDPENHIISEEVLSRDIIDNTEHYKHELRLEEQIIIASQDKSIQRQDRVECNICHKTYKAAYIKHHIIRHENPNQYVCDVCGKSFPLKQPLIRHRAIHESKFPHQCELCPYRGRYLESLKIHMLTHNDLKQYKCNVCGMKFNHQSNRNRHKKTHEKSKFNCLKCGLTYRRETFLLRHNIKIHNEGVSFDCNLCKKRYASEEQLQKHKYKVHKIYARNVRLPMYKYADLDND